MSDASVNDGISHQLIVDDDVTVPNTSIVALTDDEWEICIRRIMYTLKSENYTVYIDKTHTAIVCTEAKCREYLKDTPDLLLYRWYKLCFDPSLSTWKRCYGLCIVLSAKIHKHDASTLATVASCERQRQNYLNIRLANEIATMDDTISDSASNKAAVHRHRQRHWHLQHRNDDSDETVPG